ncbi:MAG: response regulator [Pseudomonadota bacterium]
MVDAIRVIIAEDDPQIAEIQQRFLQRIEGVDLVGVAHSLIEAQDLIDVFKPELLLLDIQFPGGTGLELLRDLRAANSSTDVILITAASEVSTFREALRGGAFDYILKPLVFDRLKESIDKYIEHHQKLRDMESLQQRDVDDLLPRGGADAHSNQEADGARLPKGVDALTLNKIRELFTHDVSVLNAEQTGDAIGASRTTARRYLEYLVSNGELNAEVSYGTVGRPERRYIKRQ